MERIEKIIKKGIFLIFSTVVEGKKTKIYRCDKEDRCKYETNRAYNMKRHVDTYHNSLAPKGPSYIKTCRYCGDRVDEAEMSQHLKTCQISEERKERFMCKICNEVFKGIRNHKYRCS